MRKKCLLWSSILDNIGHLFREKQQRPNEAENAVQPTSVEQEANSPSSAAARTTTNSPAGPIFRVLIFVIFNTTVHQLVRWREKTDFFFLSFFFPTNAKYCICHFLFCCLYVEPVQTGYPWQPFYNASRNTLEEVPFYLGWRAGTEAAENQMRGQKWRLTGLYTGYFLFIWRLWKAPPQKGWLAKKKKKADWENNENSSERPEKKKQWCKICRFLQHVQMFDWTFRFLFCRFSFFF